MAILQKIEKLAQEKNHPCVTISLNTHKTHPDSEKDKISLKNLLKEAENRSVEKYGKRAVAQLLDNIKKVGDEIDVRFNLDSLHIFLSNDTKSYIRTLWPVNDDTVYVSDTFALRQLIKAYNRSDEYLIAVLSKGGVSLYEALDDTIEEEVRNSDFPFPETPYYIPNAAKGSDPKYVDSMVREFLNRVDKAIVKVCAETGLDCIVIATEENYTMLQQVADKPDIYIGFAPINYNESEPHHVVKQSWEIVRNLQNERKAGAISEMKEAVSESKVLTDLQEIYRAAIDGRGELLIARQDFSQAVKMKDERTFKRADNESGIDVIEDITSAIAWEVLMKKGRVVFTTQEEIKELGDIVLKLRY
ncbi:MAG: hypothetical protein Q4G48_02310 [Bacteroidia bacterium]|nr:hypothetical protein [Bacteroidia bacterium]